MPFPYRHSAAAVLVLADGTVFRGHSFGASGHTTGEVVFNTSMSGYQEILTDPSYHGQMVVLTYPHIGNTGVNPEDMESPRAQVAGLIIKDLPRVVSNFRSTESLADFLKRENIVAIYGVDTRRLTRHLREHGAQSGAILVGTDADKALELAKAFPGLSGLDLVQKVTTDKAYEWTGTRWDINTGYGTLTDPKYHVVAFDYGIKRNILRMLASRGCKVTVLPAKATAQEALALAPDGIFLSNGPGDPEPCTYAIEAARDAIESGIPVFGICLGHQIMAMASGAKTMKMKFGHHGANHPVQDIATQRVLITSQNHGFAVDPDTLPANCIITHKSLFDGTIQGLARTDKPAFCFQGHPEASPGPGDVDYLFDRFIDLMDQARAKK